MPQLFCRAAINHLAGYREVALSDSKTFLINIIVTMMDKKDAPIVALPEQEIFHVSYTHDDYNGHYVNGGKFDVSKEQLIRFLDILKKYINNRQIEDDDEIYISGIKEWQDFFFHPFGFVGYASSYEIRIHSAGRKFYLTGEDFETIDKIRLSLRDNG